MLKINQIEQQQATKALVYVIFQVSPKCHLLKNFVYVIFRFSPKCSLLKKLYNHLSDDKDISIV